MTKKKLIVEVANPKPDEYFVKKIEEINKIFVSIYGVVTSKNKEGKRC